MGASIIDSKMFRVRYVCNNVTMTTEDSPPTDIETVHIAYAFFFTSNLSCYTKYRQVIYCYSHVIYHVWFNAEENKATNTALLKSRRKLTKLFIILTVTLKANRETVGEKRTDNKLRADLFIACSHRFDGESHYLCFSLPKISP